MSFTQNRKAGPEVSFASYLVAPVIYSAFIPFIFLDTWIWCYQSICFPVYRITKVNRSNYLIFDRGRLQYLNWLERLNCNFCAYVNGVIAYAREIGSRTEQYFCPIKHRNNLSAESHPRYNEFLDFGDEEQYRINLKKIRKKLKNQ